MISIVIPAYNLGKYIYDCLESIRLQSFDDYEVIVVNDGSTDNTLDILNEYKERNPRFPLLIIDKPNGGVTAARRDGFMASKGEWISFMDGDDLLTSESLKILQREIRDGIMAVCGSYEKFADGASDFNYVLLKIKEGIYQCQDVIQFILRGTFESAPWGKLYHRSLIVEDAFEIPREITNKEDVIFNMRIFAKAHGKIAIIGEPVYRYRVQRLGSAYYTKYVGKKLDLEYEIQIYQMMMEAVQSIDGFNKAHRNCISIRNYNMLWAWRRHIKTAPNDQKVVLQKMYDETYESDLCQNSIKKYVKLFLIKLLLNS